jgi:peptidoglycan/xylan/chitin deacetylase (PgdA/CDA1 family)
MPTCLARILTAALCTLFASLPIAAGAHQTHIAITIDDLPALTLLGSQDYVDGINDSLIAGLKRHHLPATGFVVASKLGELDRARQTANLQKWLDAGFDLGNHTFSHLSPNTLGAAAYIADIDRGGVEITQMMAAMGKRPRWFRHPYLETGSPLAVRNQIDAWLAAHDYRIAPVTIVPSDYMFAEPYDAALALHQDAHAKVLRRAWLVYLQRSLTWYRKASHALYGRDIAQVLLLHATRLDADTIDDIAAMLRRNHFHVVTLDKAMKDPAYRTPEHYAGRDGIDWMERWSHTLGKTLPWDDYREPPKRIEDEYARVDRDAADGVLDGVNSSAAGQVERAPNAPDAEATPPPGARAPEDVTSAITP